MEAGRAPRIKRHVNSRVLVPRPTPREYYGHGIPRVDLEKLAGKLIVVEGADGSGRSTQIYHLVEWLEGGGHATVQVGLKRSTLVSEELEQAKQGNILSRTTFSLFYATDFADQLENTIVPALKAGFVVLSDRYIYTLMARDMFDSFVQYQTAMGKIFKRLQSTYGFTIVDGDRSPEAISHELKKKIAEVLAGKLHV